MLYYHLWKEKKDLVAWKQVLLHRIICWKSLTINRSIMDSKQFIQNPNIRGWKNALVNIKQFCLSIFQAQVKKKNSIFLMKMK